MARARVSAESFELPLEFFVLGGDLSIAIALAASRAARCSAVSARLLGRLGSLLGRLRSLDGGFNSRVRRSGS